MLGRPRNVGELAEGHRPHASRCVACHFGHGQFDVPERNQAERQQPAVARAAPLLHHPVVVGFDAEQRQRTVLPPQELLPTEPRVVREAQLGLHSVEAHVLHAGPGLPTTRPHLVEGDAFEDDVFSRETGRGDRPLDRRPMILVAPPSDERALAARGLHVRGPFEPGHPARQVLDVRSDLAQTGRQAARPHVGRLDDVGIEVHDPRDFCHICFRDGRHCIYYI